MRWDDLFAELEAQADAAAAAELASEVQDRTRREFARLRLVDRLRAAGDAVLTLTLPAVGTVHGRLLETGPDWLLLEEVGRRELLVSLPTLLGVTGVGALSDVPDSEGAVGLRLDLRWALRGLARSRTGVQVLLTDGSALAGTLDRVGSDHVDLAEHPVGEARRAGSVRQVRLVPVAAITAVRSG